MIVMGTYGHSGLRHDPCSHGKWGMKRLLYSHHPRTKLCIDDDDALVRRLLFDSRPRVEYAKLVRDKVPANLLIPWRANPFSI